MYVHAICSINPEPQKADKREWENADDALWGHSRSFELWTTVHAYMYMRP